MEEKNWLKEFLDQAAEDEIVQNLIKAGSFNQAEKLLKERITKKEDNEKGYVLLSAVYFQKGQIGSALKAVSRIIKINPKNYYAHLMLGHIYRGINLEKAREHYKKALELDPANKKLLSELLEASECITRLLGPG